MTYILLIIFLFVLSGYAVHRALISIGNAFENESRIEQAESEGNYDDLNNGKI